MSTQMPRIVPIKDFRRKTGGKTVVEVMHGIQKGTVSAQTLYDIVNRDKDLFLRYLDWYLERMKGWTDPDRLNKGKKFLQSVLQKHKDEQNTSHKIQKYIQQVDRLLSTHEQTKAKIWSRHPDIQQLLTRRVMNPETHRQQQVRTLLKTPRSGLTLFVMPDKRLALVSKSAQNVFRCDGRRYQQYMFPIQGQKNPDTFWRYDITSTQGGPIYVEEEDVVNHMKQMQKQTKYAIFNGPPIIILSDKTETVPATLPEKPLSQMHGGPDCPEDSSITVHKIKKMVSIPINYIP